MRNNLKRMTSILRTLIANKSVSQEHRKKEYKFYESWKYACKLRNVHGNITSIRHETLLLRHLENLRIKRFVDDADEEGKRSFDYFQLLREPLLVHLTSALRGWNVSRSFFSNFRHEFYISRSEKSEEVSEKGVAIRENEEESVDGEIESEKSGRKVSIVNSSSQVEGGLARTAPTLRMIGIPVRCANIALPKRVMQAEFKRLRAWWHDAACKSHRSACLLIRATLLEISTARWVRSRRHVRVEPFFFNCQGLPKL